LTFRNLKHGNVLPVVQFLNRAPLGIYSFPMEYSDNQMLTFRFSHVKKKLHIVDVVCGR